VGLVFDVVGHSECGTMCIERRGGRKGKERGKGGKVIPK
jgi:hypothetical protein